MRCLHCGKRLSLLRKFSGGEFCSEEHRQQFQQQQNDLALARLLESQTRMQRPKPAPKAEPKASRKAAQPAAAQQEAVFPEAGLLREPLKSVRYVRLFTPPLAPLGLKAEHCDPEHAPFVGVKGFPAPGLLTLAPAVRNWWQRFELALRPLFLLNLTLPRPADQAPAPLGLASGTLHGIPSDRPVASTLEAPAAPPLSTLPPALVEPAWPSPILKTELEIPVTPEEEEPVLVLEEPEPEPLTAGTAHLTLPLALALQRSMAAPEPKVAGSRRRRRPTLPVRTVRARPLEPAARKAMAALAMSSPAAGTGSAALLPVAASPVSEVPAPSPHAPQWAGDPAHTGLRRPGLVQWREEPTLQMSLGESAVHLDAEPLTGWGEPDQPGHPAGPSPCRLRPADALERLVNGLAALSANQQPPTLESPLTSIPSGLPEPEYPPTGLATEQVRPVELESWLQLDQALAAAPALPVREPEALPEAFPETTLEAPAPPATWARLLSPEEYALSSAGRLELEQLPPNETPTEAPALLSAEEFARLSAARLEAEAPEPVVDERPAPVLLSAAEYARAAEEKQQSGEQEPAFREAQLPLMLGRLAAREHGIDGIHAESVDTLWIESVDAGAMIPRPRLKLAAADGSDDRPSKQASLLKNKGGAFTRLSGAVPGRRFWHTAPADLKWVAVGLPLILLLVVFSFRGVAPKFGVDQRAALGAGKTVVGGQMNTFQRVLSTRAAIHLFDDFAGGLGNWDGVDGWSKSWRYTPNQALEPGSLALYAPSVGLKNYTLEFLGQVEHRTLNWVFRAKDLKNYYGVRIQLVRGGPLPQATIQRYAVIEGKTIQLATLPIPFPVREKTIYRVRTEVEGNRFATYIQGSLVDNFTDDRLDSGGVGFYSQKGDTSTLHWVEITHQDDYLGRLCAFLAPPVLQSEARKAD